MSTVKFVFVQDCCIICHKAIVNDAVEHTKVTPKRLSILIHCNIIRGYEQLEWYLKSELAVVYVHVICRKSYIDTRF